MLLDYAECQIGVSTIEEYEAWVNKQVKMHYEGLLKLANIL